MHTHHAQNQLKRSGNSAAIKPTTRPPTAAEAVHPYQYISGARKSKTESTKSRERCVPKKKNDALRGIDGKQREPAQPRNDIEERERCPKGKREATNCRSGYHDSKPLILFMT
jgi:hypothetical protein